MKRPIYIYVLILFVLTFESHGETIWDKAASHNSLEPRMFYAIALLESDDPKDLEAAPWPWTLNILENGKWKGHYYKSKEEAAKVLMDNLERGNDWVDVGLAQINLHYNSSYVEHPLELLDPATNLDVAGKVIKYCESVYDTTLGALACYNSGDMDAKGLAYAKKVLNRYEFVVRSKVFEKNLLRLRSKKLLADTSFSFPTPFDRDELVNDMFEALKNKQFNHDKRSGVRIYE